MLTKYSYLTHWFFFIFFLLIHFFSIYFEMFYFLVKLISLYYVTALYLKQQSCFISLLSLFPSYQCTLKKTLLIIVRHACYLVIAVSSPSPWVGKTFILHAYSHFSILPIQNMRMCWKILSLYFPKSDPVTNQSLFSLPFIYIIY